jgi:hypothetical protein
MTRETLHEMIDRIRESEIVTVQRALQRLPKDASFRAALSAPPDDEPVTGARAGWLRTTMYSANSEFEEVCLA